MVDNAKSKKRRVNPALLLGGGSDTPQKKEQQPSLVETESFEQRPSRKEFKAPTGVTSLPNPFAKKDTDASDKGVSSSISDDTVNDSTDDAVEEDVVERTDAGMVKPGSLGGVIPGARKSVPNPFAGGVVTPPKATGASVKLPKASDELGDAKELKTPEAGAESRRRVNPMFLAGEEKEHVDTPMKPSRPAEKMIRPSFILQGDNVPSNRIPKHATKPENDLFKNKPDDEVKPRSQYSRKIESNVDFEEWTEDTSSDTSLGLGGEADNDYIEPQYSKAFHLTTRDIIMMRFLARYRYAYTDQLARLVDSMPRTISARLRVLEKRGFVRRQAITERQYLWMTRKAGNLIVDINFSEIRKGSLSYATIAHTIGLANLGVEFEREAGGKDLLGEGKNMKNWITPENRWKLGIWGNPEGKTMGEMTVTEREIRQGQLRWRGGRSSKEMRELVDLAVSSPDAPEQEEGQEGLFVIYGAGGKGGEHIPDLVVARERDEDGKPQHLAIELELTPKSTADWRKILKNYRDNGQMYSKIYYFTHKRAISTALQRVNEEVGLGDRLVVRKYVPQNAAMPFWG